MATRRHGETQAPLEGFEGALESGLEWLQERARGVLYVTIAIVAAGGLAAGTYEWLEYREATAQADFDRVERELTLGLGGRLGFLEVPEPANREQARSAREAALAAFEELIERYEGRIAGHAAILRAAHVEIDLGRLEDAEARLQTAAERLASEPWLRASALRLHGYVLEELGRPAEAGEAYAAAASVPEYPAREVVWISAGESFLRAGQTDRAIGAFNQALDLAPDLGRLRDRVEGLEVLRSSGG